MLRLNSDVIHKFILIIQYGRMSFNDLRSRKKSRYSDQKYENSSIRSNRTIRSGLDNFSVDLPQINNKKYTDLEKEIVNRQIRDSSTILNLTNTKYALIQVICEELHWKVEASRDTNKWTIKWSDTAISGDTLAKMSYMQRINHFPGMSIISRKNSLADCLSRMREQCPQQYDFYPRTFLHPTQFQKLKKYQLQSRKRGLLKTFIVKPQASCQGRGIYLTQNLTQVERNSDKCVVQKYICNPLLYKGLKFDLRIYVLIASVDPLRVYIYNEGLVRLATEPYQLPCFGNLDNYFMHLTNYAINKEHPAYQFNTSAANLSQGHKRSVAEFFKTLKQMGFKANQYWSQIKDIVIKTMLAAQPYLQNQYKASRPNDAVSDMCFEVLGFDFMIDNRDKCYLLEVNHTPSFSTDTPLDELIKSNLIKDTLMMMNYSSEELHLKDDVETLNQKQKFIKIKGNLLNQEKAEKIKLLQQARINIENDNMGTYERIFPCKTFTKQQKYLKLLATAVQSFKSSTNQVKLSQNNTKNVRNPQKSTIRKLVTEASSATSAKQMLFYNYAVKNNSHQQIKPKPKARTSASNTLTPIQSIGPSRTQSKLKQHENEKNRQKNQTKEKEKTQKSSLDYKRIQRTERIAKLITRDYIKSLTKPVNEDQPTVRDLSSFKNRVKSYKTPFMS